MWATAGESSRPLGSSTMGSWFAHESSFQWPSYQPLPLEIPQQMKSFFRQEFQSLGMGSESDTCSSLSFLWPGWKWEWRTTPHWREKHFPGKQERPYAVEGTPVYIEIFASQQCDSCPVLLKIIRSLRNQTKKGVAMQEPADCQRREHASLPQPSSTADCQSREHASLP